MILKVYSGVTLVIWFLLLKHILDYFNVYPFNTHYEYMNVHFGQVFQEHNMLYEAYIPLKEKNDHHHSYITTHPPYSFSAEKFPSSVELVCHIPQSLQTTMYYIQTQLMQSGKPVRSYSSSMMHSQYDSLFRSLYEYVLNGFSKQESIATLFWDEHIHAYDEMKIKLTTHDGNFIYSDCHLHLTHIRYILGSDTFYYMITLLGLYIGFVLLLYKKGKVLYDENLKDHVHAFKSNYL